MPEKIQKAFHKAMKIGHDYHMAYVKGGKPSIKSRFLYGTLRKIVAKVVRDKLGGKLMGMISGSAAISEDLMIFFHSLDMKIVQGYGLTETAPVTHICRTKYN